jgi:hypothetical protein
MSGDLWTALCTGNPHKESQVLGRANIHMAVNGTPDPAWTFLQGVF